MPVREIVFDSASELWDAVSPTSIWKYFASADSGELVFRGQRDARWHLIPSALRCDDPARILWKNARGRWPRPDEQVFVEMYTLQKFADYADNAGIQIPNDSVAFRKQLNEFCNFEGADLRTYTSKWPSEEYLGMMALVQHHGANTRLLDWTYNPYIAIYFAASSALGSIKEDIAGLADDKQLAIWVKDYRTYTGDPEIAFFRTAGAISRHAAAQQSCFYVYPPYSGRRDVDLEVSGLDELADFSREDSLLKMRVPISATLELLGFCKHIGISAAYVYPGTPQGAGVATVEELRRSILTDRLKGRT